MKQIKTSKLQGPTSRECSITKLAKLDVRRLKFLWCLVLGAWCFSASAQNPAGPYVVMPGITTGNPNSPSYSGTFTGNGSGLTNVTAVNTVSGGMLPNGLYVQSLAGAWTADSFDTYTDSQPVTAWPDVSGQNNTLSCAALTYSHNGCNGRPAVLFATYGTSFATNYNFLSNYALNTNITMFVVVRDLITGVNANLDYLISFGSTYPGTFNWTDYAGIGPSGNAAYFVSRISGGFGDSYGCMNAGNVDVMALSYNGAYYSVWQNGWQEFDGRYTGSGQTEGIGTSGSLYLGGLAPANPSANCYVSLLLIYSNCLTSAQIQQDNSAIRAAYGLTGNGIMLSGDSVTIGNNATAQSNLTYNAVASFPGWNVGNCGVSGMTSSNQVNYLLDFAPSGSRAAPFNIDLFMEQINDNGNGWAPSITETNYILAAQTAHSNFWKFIACTIPSYKAGDANGSRTNFNIWLQLNWRGFADGICDYAGLIPAMGTNGACTNQPTYFGSDYTHPTAAGYVLMSNVEVSAIQNLLQPTANRYGTFYPGTLNLQFYTNTLAVGETALTYSKNASGVAVPVRIQNVGGTITITDPGP